MRRQSPRPEPTSAMLGGIFVIILEKQQKLDEIRPFWAEYVDPALLSRAEYREVLKWAIDIIARRKLWDDADALAEQLQNSDPTNSAAYHTRAPILIAKNDVEGYRRLCGEIISRFGDATDPNVADKMAKDCLILPSSGVDLQAVAALAEVAVSRGSKSSLAPYFKCCKAMAEFRLGHYEEAANWAQQAAQGPFPLVQAEATAIMAMSQFKLNQLDKARSALADCNKAIEEKLPKAEKGDLGKEWRDWIIAHALQSEAKRMIDGEPSPTAHPANVPR